MEADGIISRTVFPEVPPRVEYALTELGESMRPIIDVMAEWGTNCAGAPENEKDAGKIVGYYIDDKAVWLKIKK